MSEEKTYQPSGVPLLCLLQLSFSPDDGKLKNTELLATLGRPQREKLKEQDFITVNDKVRPMELKLTEFGWGWLEDNIDGDLTWGKSPAVAVILQMLILRTQPLRRKGLCFSDFTQEGKLETAIIERYLPQYNDLPQDDHRDKNIDQKARSTLSEQGIFKMAEAAYLALSHGKSNVRVYLKDLKEKLRHIPPSILNKTLFDAHCASDKNLVLYPLDDRSSITPEDNQAAVSIEGCDFHILYMERSA